MIVIITIILFCIGVILFGNMDTQKDKWMFYETSFHKKLATFLFKLKMFKTQEDADFWFNSTGQSWRNAYIDRIKDPSLPNSNKIQYNILGIKFDKPAPLVDAWHYFKWLLIICICLIVTINLPILFLFVYPIIVKIIYFNTLGIIWYFLFKLSYNNK